tara:strand:+ start:1396 stop:1881 length:486 start_codon:yes stop_codon:yes gene_type:complete
MAVLNPNDIMFTAFEPKVQNRFVMLINGIPSFMVKTASAPSFEDEEVKLDHINTYRKIRGKREWGNMDMTLYDPITPSGAQAVMDWARLSYESVTGRAGYSDFYKKDLTLNILGPVGDIVSEWVIKGAFITSMSQGDFDWASSDVAELSITVAMDYCVLNY